MSKNTTATWGSNAWTLMHTISFLCYQKKDTYLFGRVKTFIRHYWKILPCARCRADASKYLENNDILAISKPEKIFEYTWTFHNFVNRKLKKQTFSYEQYINKYSSVTQEHIHKINTYTEYLKRYGSQSGISSFNLKHYMGFIRFLHSYCKLLQLKL
jgi:hypothetical protein